ncbi:MULTISPECIES: nuclear transport factor 2 family protein [unclassified Mesorhizobium]|uniref:nuclear transport factor 2 family protein n=1 Tax=unclassified Mesorhizobium TaxID=325217 RepID=UPI000FCCAB6C|nr:MULTISPECIES: nuclear transport factor 2 family protein [unclassified Mesorhizobium]RUW31237.1 nuclear transport factor 2 family protein [Mesorhizobium sp. M1E.F.Ca.ET.041.01.1.1]RWD87571.1 MAG: nuclear transport factor 2 family protein [Mesorhizobium sp.]RWD87693.1 MAG: nuclear transport factor 2 family protein [Mesorhizobium sp.]TIV51286.1 MAG: nuclear transport factor 2 family protein [Mesorhizobium sp.]
MTTNHDLFPSLSALLRQALGDVLAPDARTFLDMCTDDILFEFPFTPPGGTSRLDGKAALEAYLPTVATLITIESMALGRVLVSAQSDAAAIEFSCKGYANQTGARYDQDYVSMLDLKDGRIARYRDSWNPLVVLAASAGSHAANETRTKGAKHDG